MTTSKREVRLAQSRFGVGRLFFDATSMASSSLTNAAFGMASWAMTARLIPPAELGVMTAVLSAITTPALAISATIGDGYSSLLPAVGSNRPQVYRLGQRIFFSLALIGGVVAGLASTTYIDGVEGSVPIFLMCVAGTVLVGMSMLQNSAIPALGRANWLVSTTIALNVTRLTLLYFFAVTFKWHSFELSTIIASGAVALTLSKPISRIVRSSKWLPPSALSLDQSLAAFKKYISQSAISTTFSYAIFASTPFLVATFSSAEQTALFALSLPLAQTLDLISVALGISLLIHGSAEPAGAAAMARTVLVRAVAVVAVGGITITAFAPTLLSHLNSAYKVMHPTAVIGVLCFASLLRTPFTTWSALQRSRRNLRPVLIAAGFGAVAGICSVAFLSARFGALGGAFGVAAGYGTLAAGAAIHTAAGRRRGS